MWDTLEDDDPFQYHAPRQYPATSSRQGGWSEERKVDLDVQQFGSGRATDAKKDVVPKFWAPPASIPPLPPPPPQRRNPEPPSSDAEDRKRWDDKQKAALEAFKPVSSTAPIPTHTTTEMSGSPPQNKAPEVTSGDSRLEQQQSASSGVADGSVTCCVCLDNRRSVVCVPCGHMALCGKCSNGIDSKLCPVCRSTAEFIRVIVS
jgi:hypothetical protein